MPKPKVGLCAPEFALFDRHGKMHLLKDYHGAWVLLYFYPKDDTLGCTNGACTIRDTYGDFKKIKAVVLGVSVDSLKSHDKFVKKYSLPLTLLADERKDVVKAYGVLGKKKFMGKGHIGTRRTSFLIDPGGNIAKVYEHVKPVLHASEVLSDLNRDARKR